MALGLRQLSRGPDSATRNLTKITTQGHGLCTLDGEQNGLERVVVSTVATGFFPSWMKFLGIPTDTFPRQKPKEYADLAKQSPSSWLTVPPLPGRGRCRRQRHLVGRLPIHHSPFERTALIVPAFENVGEYRAICVALLYALPIMVRYRPSVWRRVQEGDHIFAC